MLGIFLGAFMFFITTIHMVVHLSGENIKT